MINNLKQDRNSHVLLIWELQVGVQEAPALQPLGKIQSKAFLQRLSPPKGTRKGQHLDSSQHRADNLVQQEPKLKGAFFSIPEFGLFLQKPYPTGYKHWLFKVLDVVLPANLAFMHHSVSFLSYWGVGSGCPGLQGVPAVQDLGSTQVMRYWYPPRSLVRRLLVQGRGTLRCWGLLLGFCICHRACGLFSSRSDSLSLASGVDIIATDGGPQKVVATYQ